MREEMGKTKEEKEEEPSQSLKQALSEYVNNQISQNKENTNPKTIHHLIAKVLEKIL